MGFLACAGCSPRLAVSSDAGAEADSSNASTSDESAGSSADLSGETSTTFGGDEGAVGESCDLYDPQCEAGLKCAEVEPGVNLCSALDDDPANEGEPCETDPSDGVDTCDEGLRCVLVAPTSGGVGVCRAYCSLQPPSASLVCLRVQEECVGEPAAFCVLACDPLDPSSCGTDETCGLLTDYWVGYACGMTSGGAQSKGSCSNDFDCPSSEVCTEASRTPGCGSAMCCAPTCDRDAPVPTEDCPTDTVECRERISAKGSVGVCSL